MTGKEVIEKVEAYKVRTVGNALNKAKEEYQDAEGSYNDTGYDRYYNKMNRLEKTIEELEAYIEKDRVNERLLELKSELECEKALYRKKIQETEKKLSCRKERWKMTNLDAIKKLELIKYQYEAYIKEFKSYIKGITTVPGEVTLGKDTLDKLEHYNNCVEALDMAIALFKDTKSDREPAFTPCFYCGKPSNKIEYGTNKMICTECLNKKNLFLIEKKLNG